MKAVVWSIAIMASVLVVLLWAIAAHTTKSWRRAHETRREDAQFLHRDDSAQKWGCVARSDDVAETIRCETLQRHAVLNLEDDDDDCDTQVMKLATLCRQNDCAWSRSVATVPRGVEVPFS